MRLRTLGTRALLGLTGAAVAAAGAAGTASGQERSRCSPVEGFLAGELAMAVVVEPDTLDDWRTGRRLPGCRVTAAGTTTEPLPDAAETFYRRLRAAGWDRTPSPADAPQEASLRFRLDATDCLFNVYSGVLLGTEAELEVSSEATPGPGETRINLLVLCASAREAAPPVPGAYSLVAPPAGRELLCAHRHPRAVGAVATAPAHRRTRDPCPSTNTTAVSAATRSRP